MQLGQLQKIQGRTYSYDSVTYQQSGFERGETQECVLGLRKHIPEFKHLLYQSTSIVRC